MSAQRQICLRTGPKHHGTLSTHFLKPLGLVLVLSREPRPWRQEARDIGELAFHTLLAGLS